MQTPSKKRPHLAFEFNGESELIGLHLFFNLCQVDLSDSETEYEPGEDRGGGDGPAGGDGGGGAGGGGGSGEDAIMGGKRSLRGTAGDLGVNKKGTPLYSKEDIREQYCINDKELEVLDRTHKKGLLGCFSNQGQVLLDIYLPSKHWPLLGLSFQQHQFFSMADSGLFLCQKLMEDRSRKEKERRIHVSHTLVDKNIGLNLKRISNMLKLF